MVRNVGSLWPRLRYSKTIVALALTRVSVEVGKRLKTRSLQFAVVVRSVAVRVLRECLQTTSSMYGSNFILKLPRP